MAYGNGPTLTSTQRALARWCVADLPAIVLSVLFPPMGAPGGGRSLDATDIDGAANPAVYDASWGNLKGREEEFYRGCARRVDARGGVASRRPSRCGGRRADRA